MARSKNNQRAAATRVAVDVESTGTRQAPASAVLLLVLSVLAAVWAVAMMTKPGRVAYYYFFLYAEYFMGVISLVALSVTIMVGLVATDRLVLSIRQRVLLQSAHRTTGVVAVSSLFLHVWTKFAEDHIGLIDIFVPFLYPGLNKVYVGLGTISAWIMVMVMWTGIARSRFVGHGKPWMWRGIHAISYLMWPIALMHGLSAGRPAATWVTVSYVVCVLAVLVGLAVRLSVSLNRKKNFASPAGMGGPKTAEIGKLVPTSAAPIRRGGRRGAEPPVDLLAPAGPAADTWVPAAPPPRPVSPAPVAAPRPPAMAPEADYPTADYPQARGRRQPELEAPAPRPRRAADDDDLYDTSTRAISRRDIEDRREVEDERYRYDDEPAPRTRGNRSQEIYDAGPRRARRFDDDEPDPRETTGTRMRRDDIESTGTRMRRDDIESTGTRMRRDDIESTGTRMRRYADDEPPPRSRRREPEYDDEPAARTGDVYDDVPRQRGRYADEEPPRRSEGRRGSRSQFVDLATDGYDESPTLVDAAPRRSRRAPEPDYEPRGGRRARGRADEDEAYFSQLRGETN
ncbi:translation initiation factor III [Actinoplanes sp. GCM10030250]|uniref:translation initiation factor III n=1 Tax=Actinoplanes sp. GCM10030250 TaxID=3273376 RepID=UPI00360D16C8